ncbi:alpha/beta hydrolase [Streptomyces sp. Li-HN-5-11]|uniref:alpha/beta fold hydrolase n=1 Tax=Streptomyces sp. Li-HN-5-11 TaxID=3075432 RepID=UPI0028AE79BD|nr:alpha/beta hydrolase [Streptomyces sp. Li-HN-5-11]WNM35889.1 alpha/beta hydrolase [Streptomyces sp. Li-HN-5-11]
MLVHGAGQGARMWRRQLSALSDDFHVVAPDLPGFGATPGPFSMTAAVECVAEVARELRPVHLCGHSLGAIVAAWVAAEYPGLVGRLVLSGGPEIAPGRTSARRLRRERHRPGRLVRAISDLPDRAGWIDVLDALETSDLSDALPRIAAPTLVLCGKRDRASLPDARRTAAAIPGARLCTVPHTGHLMPMTAPHAFNAIVRGFLDAGGERTH